MSQKELSIGQVAEYSGLSIDTLRYYEKLGLIDPVERAASGHRRYGEADLRRIDFLKRLRATGMSISDMQYYVELYRTGDSTLAERRIMLETHRAKLIEEIALLEDTVAFLDGKIASYIEQEQPT